MYGLFRTHDPYEPPEMVVAFEKIEDLLKSEYADEVIYEIVENSDKSTTWTNIQTGETEEHTKYEFPPEYYIGPIRVL